METWDMDEEAMQKNLGRMAKVIEMTPFMRRLGMEFVEGSEGYARIKLRFQHENSTVGKALHAAPSPRSSTPPVRWPPGQPPRSPRLATSALPSAST